VPHDALPLLPGAPSSSVIALLEPPCTTTVCHGYRDGAKDLDAVLEELVSLHDVLSLFLAQRVGDECAAAASDCMMQ
jgi:hypothetical protein